MAPSVVLVPHCHLFSFSLFDATIIFLQLNGTVLKKLDLQTQFCTIPIGDLADGDWGI